MKYLTINEVTKLLNDLQEGHPMLRSFGYGPPEELEQRLIANGGAPGESEPSKMPFLWVFPIRATIQKGSATYNIEAAIGDLVREGEQNKDDVQSDAFSLCIDVFATLRNSIELLPGSKIVFVTETSTTNPFEEKYESGYAGQIMTFSIQTMIDYNYCEVPTN